eukprot:1146678-Pelagomonas_calceolata.AAC.2
MDLGQKGSGGQGEAVVPVRVKRRAQRYLWAQAEVLQRLAADERRGCLGCGKVRESEITEFKD